MCQEVIEGRNTDGKIRIEKNYNSENILESSRQIQFDNGGAKLEEITQYYDPNGNVKSKKISDRLRCRDIEYDEQGRIVRIGDYSKTYALFNAEYVYDTKTGELAKKVQTVRPRYIDGVESWVECTDEQFYQDGKFVGKRVRYNIKKQNY